MDQREELVEKLCNQGYIRTEKVKKAMLNVPREEFMPPEIRAYAYLDPVSYTHLDVYKRQPVS